MACAFRSIRAKAFLRFQLIPKINCALPHEKHFKPGPPFSPAPASPSKRGGFFFIRKGGRLRGLAMLPHCTGRFVLPAQGKTAVTNPKCGYHFRSFDSEVILGVKWESLFIFRKKLQRLVIGTSLCIVFNRSSSGTDPYIVLRNSPRTDSSPYPAAPFHPSTSGFQNRRSSLC